MKTKTTKKTTTAAVQNTLETLRAMHRLKPLYGKLGRAVDAITTEITSGAKSKRQVQELLAVNAEIYSDLAETVEEIARLSAAASKEFAPVMPKRSKATKKG